MGFSPRPLRGRKIAQDTRMPDGRLDRELLFERRGLLTVHILPRTAEYAAELRARYGMRLPDALQIAVAVKQGVRRS